MVDAAPVVDAAKRQALLAFARATARRILEGEDAARAGSATPAASGVPPPPIKPVIEGRFGGVFVTIWRGHSLRGCVGTFAPTSDLAATVGHITRSSLDDPRFTGNPITAAELPSLTIEISVLSDLVPTDQPDALVPGAHGIKIQRGERSGCFLPKVAAERGWTAEEFLSACCTMKANLPADAWRDPRTQVYLFTAEVFSEADGT